MSLATAGRGAVQSVDRDLPTLDMRTLEQLNADNASGVQYSAPMMFAFALIALPLALGARPGDVLRMIVANSVKLAAGSWLWIALVLMRIIASLLVGVVRLDLPILLAITAMLGLDAAAAGYIPARRAAQIDPIASLRNE